MRPMTNSRKVRFLDRMMARRYRETRSRYTKSSARRLRKHVKRSRFEGKASEARREQVLYVQCRRTFLAWANRLDGILGAITVVGRTRTSMEVRFGNLNPVLSFSVSVMGVGVFVTVGRYHDWNVEFDSAPRWRSGGYVCDLVMPEYVVVYPDRFALWRTEVFDRFQQWFAGGFAATALYPGKHVLNRDGYICFPVFVNASETTSREGTV